jgi:hypothetical protein
MGATLRTFALRRAKSGDVRQTLVSWLRAKGFELSEGPVLFPFDPVTERGLVLSENGDWTIVAYSHEMEEGDRLVFELNKLRKPLLELWVYDSDIWGYRLHNAGRLAASFNSNPRYFGGPAELDLPQNGDPELLCEVCELATDGRRIAAIQLQRAVFAESVAERFCVELGAEPAALDHRDFEDLPIEPGQVVTAGGFRIERLLFARLEEARKTTLRLHDAVVRSPQPPPVDPELAQWQAQMQRQMLPLTIVLRVVMSLVGAVGRAFGPLFRVWWRWRGAEHVRKGSVLREILARDTVPRVERRGAQLINRRHRCSITVPDHAELLPGVGPDAVFRFRLGQVFVHTEAIRPSQLRARLQLWPQADVVEDEKLFVDGLPARMLLIQGVAAGRKLQSGWYLVETEDAVYRFHARGEELSADVRQQLRAILESFRAESADASVARDP